MRLLNSWISTSDLSQQWDSIGRHGPGTTSYLISEKIAYNNDRHDEDHDVEDFKIEVH